jgi:predicted DNA-binding transcriptional regulator YafY
VLPETSIHNKKTNYEVLPVWDTDIGAWRSFRLDSIKDVKKLEVIL